MSRLEPVVALLMGDEDKPYVRVEIGGACIVIYESLLADARVVVDVDVTVDQEVAVTVNDDYVHGGPA